MRFLRESIKEDLWIHLGWSFPINPECFFQDALLGPPKRVAEALPAWFVFQLEFRYFVSLGDLFGIGRVAFDGVTF